MSLNRYPQHRAVQPSMPDEFKQLFERFFQVGDSPDESPVVTSQWAPRVDIREAADRFVILADLPGIDPADVEIWMDKGILSIKGERRSENGEQNERYSRIERRYGSFHRRFALPDSADSEGITANGRHGVLEISIPKRPEPRHVASMWAAAPEARASKAAATAGRRLASKFARSLVKVSRAA